MTYVLMISMLSLSLFFQYFVYLWNMEYEKGAYFHESDGFLFSRELGIPIFTRGAKFLIKYISECIYLWKWWETVIFFHSLLPLSLHCHFLLIYNGKTQHCMASVRDTGTHTNLLYL